MLDIFILFIEVFGSYILYITIALLIGGLGWIVIGGSMKLLELFF